jgi:hypothetical protein
LTRIPLSARSWARPAVKLAIAPFRGRVGKKLRRWGCRVYRGSIDDGGARLEVRQCRLDQIKHAVDVGAEGVIPLCVSDLLHALVGHLEGGVVDENVEPPKSLQGSVHQLAAVGRIGDVAGNRYGASSRLLDPVRGFSCLLILAEIGYHYVRPLAGKRDCHSAANAGIGAGDQGNASIEFSIATIRVFPMIGTRRLFGSRPRTLLLLSGKRRPGFAFRRICCH